MARELFTTWTDYQAAVDRLLCLAGENIGIFDYDLGHLKLDSPSRLIQLQRLLHGKRQECLKLALQDAGPLKRGHPRLMEVYAAFAHVMAVQQMPVQLAGLRDSMILVDGRHGLIRFDREQPRCKLLIDEGVELLPYQKRFDDLWREGGTAVGPTTLGL